MISSSIKSLLSFCDYRRRSISNSLSHHCRRRASHASVTCLELSSDSCAEASLELGHPVEAGRPGSAN
jgi:hypothetical protein